MSKSTLKVSNLNFAYDKKKILNNVSVQIEEGKVVGLLGENGSGKTTLLNCIYGFLPTKKEIEVLGLHPSLDEDDLKQNVTYIQDTPPLLDYLTGKQYMSYLFRIYGLDYQEEKERLKALLEKFGLFEDYTDKLIVNYSFGMKKKIQIVSELILNRKLVIIDEPTNGLDIKSMYELKQLILQINQTYNTTFLISSHNIGFLEDVCHEVLLFSKGEIRKHIHNLENLDLEKEMMMVINDVA